MNRPLQRPVWLIDDDELSNYVNKTILTTQQFAEHIVVFSNAQQALTALQAGATQAGMLLPEVIFLDMDMPILDGWDFLLAYRQLPDFIKNGCQLYMLTSSISDADAEKASTYKEVVGFISKPLTPATLNSIHSLWAPSANE